MDCADSGMHNVKEFMYDLTVYFYYPYVGDGRCLTCKSYDLVER